jgi:hypothetical protein
MSKQLRQLNYTGSSLSSIDTILPVWYAAVRYLDIVVLDSATPPLVIIFPLPSRRLRFDCEQRKVVSFRNRDIGGEPAAQGSATGFGLNISTHY